MAEKPDTDVMYQDLPADVAGDPGPSTAGMVHDTDKVRKTFVKNYLKRSLPSNRLQQSEEMDMKHKVLSLDAKHQPRRKPNPRRSRRKAPSRRERQDQSLFKLAPEDIKYDLYKPLHELWKDYIRDLLGIDKITERNMKEAEKRLLKADLHGAIVTVSKATLPTMIGLTGIILQETKNVFKIVTEKDKLKTLPKFNTAFSYCIDQYMFEIHGTNFMFRTGDRACKSFKVKPSTDM